MATPTLTVDFTTISTCDATTNWTANSIGTNADIQVEGNACLEMILRGVNRTGTYTPGAAIDLSNTHIRLWFNCTWFGLMDTKANGGLQIFVSDGTNTGYWNVLGGDEYTGGWVLLVVDTRSAVDVGTKPTMTSITSLGFRGTQTGTPKNVDNTWWDYFVYGDGYVVTGGTGGATESNWVHWTDVAAQDLSSGYGVVQEIGGVFFVNGKLTFGDAGGTGSVYFRDTGQTVVFRGDLNVDTALYQMSVVGNATGTTEFQQGTKSGTAGISGCTWKTEGTAARVGLDATDTDVSVFKLYGSSFISGGTFKLPATSANREVLDCSFDGCYEVEASTCKVENCKFISSYDGGSSDGAVLISSTSHAVKDCSFIACPDGWHVNAAGTYACSGNTFTGCTYDVEFSATGDLTINNENGANTSTYEMTGGGNSVTINTSVFLRVYVEDENGNDIQNAQCAIYDSSDTQLMNEDSTASGLAEETYNYTTDENITVRVRKSSTGDTRFVPVKTTGTITDGGFTVTVVLRTDQNTGL